MSLKGQKELIKRFQQIVDKAEKETQAILDANALEIVADAKRNAPANFGTLQQSIRSEDDGKDTRKIVVGVPYGAYVEFGTGAKVQVPAELQDVANQFRGGGTGSFEKGLQSIKDWVKAKGLPEEAAYPIFLSILRNGIRPQPYLYPAFVKGRKQFVKDLTNLVKTLSK